MAASLGSFVGFCGHYWLTGTVSFYSVFSPYLGVKEPALSGSDRADWSLLVHVIPDWRQWEASGWAVCLLRLTVCRGRTLTLPPYSSTHNASPLLIHPSHPPTASASASVHERKRKKKKKKRKYGGGLPVNPPSSVNFPFSGNDAACRLDAMGYGKKSLLQPKSHVFQKCAWGKV